MAAIVCTINMRIGRLSALMAFRNDIIRDPLTQPFIKDKVFSDEFTCPARFL